MDKDYNLNDSIKEQDKSFCETSVKLNKKIEERRK